MGTRSQSFKYTLGLIAATLVVIGTIADINYYAPGTLVEDEVGLGRFAAPRRIEEDSRQREVASNDYRTKYSILYFPDSVLNRKKIDGNWRVYNFIEVSDAANPANLKEEGMNVRVELELIGNSKIVVDNDPHQVFRISLMTPHTIALVKKVGEGFEILELRREFSAVQKGGIKAKGLLKGARGKTNYLAGASGQEADSQNKKGVVVPQDMYLVLERAFNPNISKNIFVGEYVSGSMSFANGNVQALEVTIARGMNVEQSISIDLAEVKDGGTFEAEVGGEMVSGIITNNGENSFRLRFANGPMQGAMLNFVTDEEFDRLAEIQKGLPKPQEGDRSIQLGSAGVRTEQQDTENSEQERKNVTQLETDMNKDQVASPQDNGEGTQPQVSEPTTQTQQAPAVEEGEVQEREQTQIDQEGQQALDQDTAYSKQFTSEYMGEKEMAEHLKKSGFDFGQPAPKRQVASE